MTKRTDIRDVGSVPLELSDEERRLGERFAMALRRMDDKHREAALTLVGVVEGLAIKFPRHAAPALRMVKGGAA